MGKRIRCNKCGNEWEYKGLRKNTQNTERTIYITCPFCYAKVPAPFVEEKPEDEKPY